MSRNGAGVYSLVNNTWYPPVNGVLATSTDWSTFITDIANALTQSVSSDGQTPMTGNLPMGGNKITGLANGSAATDAAAFGQVAQIVGQCQLTKSGSNIILLPYNGNKLFINGVLCTVPAAGLTLAPGALAASTVYNIYAVATGTAVTSIEASTTARATDATYGNQVKSGDSTRALVGKARTTSGTAWADTATQRFVISWFNKRKDGLYIQSSGALTTSSGTPQPLLSLEFLCWGDEGAQFSTNGMQSNNTANSVNSNSMGIDSTSVNAFVPTNWQAYANNTQGPAVTSYQVRASQITEGYHTVYAQGWVAGGGGTASWAAPSGFEFAGMVTV